MAARQLRIPVTREVVFPSDPVHPVNLDLLASLVEFYQVRVCARIVPSEGHSAIASHFWVHVLGYKVFARRRTTWKLSFAPGKVPFKDLERRFRMVTNLILKTFPHWSYVMVVDLFGSILSQICLDYINFTRLFLYINIWQLRWRKLHIF